MPMISYHRRKSGDSSRETGKDSLLSMKKDDDGMQHRLPPPPLFTIRPPPTPPGSLFENFHTVEILNGRCIRPLLNFSSPTNVLQKHEEPINWLNIVLLILAAISVIFCIIIAVFIFICLKKLRKEEKQYQSYIMSGTLSSKGPCYRRHHMDSCTRTSEHYKCTSNRLNCCDDYYSHQLMPMTSISSPQPVKPTEPTQSSSTDKPVDGQETPQTHQYECIPEYLLTMTRHHHPPIVCHHPHKIYQPIGSPPYNTFSRSYLLPQGAAATSASDGSQCTCSPPAAAVQEESSVPLLAPTQVKEARHLEEASSRMPLIVGWTRRNQPATTKRKATEHRRSFLSHLRKSSIL